MAWFLTILLLLMSDDVSGFAAKKKPNKKKGSSASSNKGFGAAPPTLEEVASKFRLRTPDDAPSLPCPCQVGNKLYSDCCLPYHNGEKAPESPLRVLQSRYSAFSYRLVPYVITTTHPSSREYRDNKVQWAKDLNKEGMFDSFEFVQLVIPDLEPEMDGDDQAYMNFQVRLRAKGGDNMETIVSERSLFKRDPETNVWSYASGDVRSEEAGLEDLVLNP